MPKEVLMKRFHEIELEKSFDLIQTSQNIRIQVSIFFATVNLGALSFGVSQEKAVFFVFAAILFWVMIIIDNAIRAMLAHAYYRVIHIHKLYVKDDVSFSPHINSRLAAAIMNIATMKNDDEQLKAVQTSIIRVRNTYGFWLPLIASIIEIASGLFLWKVLGWSLI